MRIRPVVALLILFLSGTFACRSEDAETGDGDTSSADDLTIVSSSFENGEAIPAEYGCQPDGGIDKPSIPLNWSGIPEGTRELVLLMDDPDPVAEYWVHWLVVGLSPDLSSLAEGASGTAMPAGAEELENTFGRSGYGAPCPPSGSHTYRVQLFAMPEAVTAADLEGRRGDRVTQQLMSTALASGRLEGVYP